MMLFDLVLGVALLVVQASANIPNNPNDVGYPATIVFSDDPGIPAGGARTVTRADMSAASFDFVLDVGNYTNGVEWFLKRAEVTVEGSSVRWDRLIFYPSYKSSWTAYGSSSYDSVAFSFVSYHQGSSYYVNSYGAFPDYEDQSNITLSAGSITQLNGSNANPYALRQTWTCTTTSAGPYYVHFVDSDKNRRIFDNLCASYIAAAYNTADGSYYYSRGFDAGEAQGYQEGYIAGTEAGAGSVDAVSTLFGAVLSVPISLFNGMSPLVVWNTPIISIIFSLLFIAIALLIVKRCFK